VPSASRVVVALGDRRAALVGRRGGGGVRGQLVVGERALVEAIEDAVGGEVAGAPRRRAQPAHQPVPTDPRADLGVVGIRLPADVDPQAVAADGEDGAVAQLARRPAPDAAAVDAHAAPADAIDVDHAIEHAHARVIALHVVAVEDEVDPGRRADGDRRACPHRQAGRGSAVEAGEADHLAAGRPGVAARIVGAGQHRDGGRGAERGGGRQDHARAEHQRAHPPRQVAERDQAGGREPAGDHDDRQQDPERPGTQRVAPHLPIITSPRAGHIAARRSSACR